MSARLMAARGRLTIWAVAATLLLALAGIASGQAAVLDSPPGFTETGPEASAGLTHDASDRLKPPVRSDTGQLAELDLRRLHPDLRRMLAEGEAAADFVPIIVEWRPAPGALDGLAQAAAADKLAQRQAVIAALQADAASNAAALAAALDIAAARGQARNVRPFWISPVMALDARLELISELAQRLDVVQVRPDQRFKLAEVTFTPAPATASGLPWNLTMLDVASAQAGLGLDGTGVTVAILDTGVDWQHPALLTHYRGYRGRGLAVHRGNWHVSTDEPYLYPGDGYGHGTHVMGAIVGDDGEDNRIGVAPGARWIAVKAFDNAGNTFESWLHDAFQWIMAPEDDPALAPDVVNNSWGSDIGSDERFRTDVRALRLSGILPIFSAGNQGPYAKSINSPASYPEALAVGAVDDERAVANFSARGPSAWFESKPEVMAPGVNIRSAFPGGGYAKSSGTSMAAPHVAGLVALLFQIDPHIMPDQVEAILTGAAHPLTLPLPNNDAGWGLVNAYAAGLRLAANGEIAGRVVRANGQGIAFPTVTATARAGGQPVLAAGDAAGAFTLALSPGLYSVAASAFGFEPAAQPSVEVLVGRRASITLTLTAQPAGVLFGRVTDLDSGAPLSATVTLAGVPAPARTDPNTGLYSLPLPAGAYTATVAAEGHRLGRFAAAIAAGQATETDIGLRAGPRILLVDGGRWYYGSQVGFFEDALTALDYPYTLWPVRDPFGANGIGPDTPPPDALARFDAVIWSAPRDAPGIIGADAALTDYLRRGGHLLISGQDVAFWDAGGSPLDLPASYFTEYMQLWFAAEEDRATLIGVPDSPLAGLRLDLNTPDSAGQQRLPDAVTIRQPLITQPVLTWPDGPISGAVTGRCRRFRAAWLGAGLEGVGPRAARIETLDRLLTHFTIAPAPYGLELYASAEPLIGRPGVRVTGALTLQSIGASDDRVELQVEGGPWPITLILPGGRRVESPVTIALPRCATIPIAAEIAIPAGLPRDARSAYSVRVTSQNSPDAHAAVELVAKTPAAVALVDDERWRDHEERYISALTELGISFDVLSTRGGDTSPSADTLRSYPLAVWFTGSDWFRPLSVADLDLLADYLDQGGRLLLSSQELLDFEQNAGFAAQRLGVAASILSVEAEDVVGPAGNPLAGELGPWRLNYPFRNWSDGIVPDPNAFSLLQDQGLHTVAVARSADRWRTAFFAFPLEALAQDALTTLLDRTLLWLSPLGESRLEAPSFAARGAQVPITLTLGLADTASRDGLAVVLPLPAGLDPVSGSVNGPWQADPDGRTLRWSGNLAPGQQLVMTAQAVVSEQAPSAAILPLAASLDAGDGVFLQVRSPIRVDVPWLILRADGPAGEVAPGSVVPLTLHVANAGQIEATAYLTDTLPKGLTLLQETVWASRGTVRAGTQSLTWQGLLPPGAGAEIRFSVRVTALNPPGRLSDWAELTDQTGRRVVSWAIIRVRQHSYLPLLYR